MVFFSGNSFFMPILKFIIYNDPVLVCDSFAGKMLNTASALITSIRMRELYVSCRFKNFDFDVFIL